MPAAGALRLSPCGVARCAAWPLATLDALGTCEPLPALTSDRFERAYEAVLARERQALWAMTADDPQFMKALALASPSATLRVRGSALRRDAPRNRALRLAEHTLYRYLARAAGRVTPHGLWAGVATITRGHEDRIEACAARCVFTPDLRPFQFLLRALGERREYRARTLWQLNPTLDTSPEGWRFLARDAAGRVTLRSLHHDPDLARVLVRLAVMPPAAIGTLASELSGAEAGGRAAACAAMLHELAAGGALVGGLDLPDAYDSVWQALEATEERLLVADARAWRDCLDALREDCATLEASTFAATVASFESRLAAAGNHIAVLAERCAVAVPVPPVALHGDLALPWRITLSAATHAACSLALNEYEHCWRADTSAATVERAAYRADAARWLQTGRNLLAASLAPPGIGVVATPAWPAPHETEPVLAERLRHWEATLLGGPACATLTARATADEEPAPADLAPLGCWLLGLGANGRLRAHGASDLATAGSARYAEVLPLARHDRWLAHALRHASRATGLSFAALHAPCAANPNALAAPALLEHVLAPWSAEPGALDMRGAQLTTNAAGRLVLKLAHDTRDWSVLAFATAEQQADDPLSAALLVSGWRERGTRRQRALDIPTAAELNTPTSSAAVHLPCGALLTTRRSVLREDLQALRQLRGVARFRHWQALATRLDWSPLLEVSTPQGTALHVRRDSPLAVEALCKGLDATTPFLLVKAVDRDCALPVPGGAAHMVELALPFLRQAS